MTATVAGAITFPIANGQDEGSDTASSQAGVSGVQKVTEPIG